MTKYEQTGSAEADHHRHIDLDAGRRAFMRSVGVGAAGAAVLAGSALAPAWAATFDNDIGPGQGPSDVQILNFALNLEYLEAEFYLRAAFGRGLATEDTTGNGTRGGVTGGRRVNFATGAIREYAEARLSTCATASPPPPVPPA
jgi:hypothetical protein